MQVVAEILLRRFLHAHCTSRNARPGLSLVEGVASRNVKRKLGGADRGAARDRTAGHHTARRLASRRIVFYRRNRCGEHRLPVPERRWDDV